MKLAVIKSLIVFSLFILGINAVHSQGTQIDFNTIPKRGTILIYAHMDDDLIWMLPFWKISEKFIGGAMPATPSYRTIVSQQQVYLNNNGYNINYESNWITPWSSITDREYTEYYWGANPSYSYLAADHLESRLFSDQTVMPVSEINKIKAKLEQYLASPGVSRIITHNNWGEYGHQHHKALNAAVRELAVKYRKDVWMLGCNNGAFIDVTVPQGIIYALGSFNTPSLYTGIRTIYEANNRWTWYNDRVPSGDHKFIKIVDAGNDKSGILTGQSITTPGPSQSEPGAYIFDGVDDYLTIEGNNFSTFTIAMRIRPDQIRAMDISAMKEYPASGKHDRNFYMNNDGRIATRIFDGSSRVITSNSALSAGSWTHIAMTGNGGNLKIYINGVLDKTISTGSAITNYSTPELVLGQPGITDSYFRGQIYDVRLYDHVLTDSEMAILSGIASRTYTINSNAGTGGTINPSGTITVNYGSNRTYAITANNGYQISDVKIDNTSRGALSSYTFNNITANHTISVSFTQKTYTISGIAETGGSINPEGNLEVNHGDSQTFTITPDYGYSVADISVDNISIGTDSSYNFSNIIANHIIKATFKPVTYTINGKADPEGTINPAGEVKVNHGTDQAYTIIPNDGYKISDVFIDNTSIGPVNSYTFNSITANHAISATFEILTYDIASSASLGGTINPPGQINLSHGMNQTYTITPQPGFRISDVKADSVSVGPVSDFTFNIVTSSHTISASFTLISLYTVTAGSGNGGTITPKGNVTVSEGTDKTYTIRPDKGFRISDVKIDNLSAGVVPEYTFENITSDHTIFVKFSSDVAVNIYPNPYRDFFILKIDAPDDYLFDMSIHNLRNNMVYFRGKIAGNTGITFTNPLPPGIYLLKLNWKGGSIIRRIIKY